MKERQVYVTIGCNGKDDMSKGIRFAQCIEKENIPLDALRTREDYLAQTGWHENSHKYLLAGTDADAFQPVEEHLYRLFDDILKEAYGVKDTGDITFDDESLDDCLASLMEQMKKVYPSLVLLDEEDGFYRLSL